MIFGKDSILDTETVCCAFDLVRGNGKRMVMGGELRAQCVKFPWLLIRIDLQGVTGEPVWSLEGRLGRPNLRQSVGCSFDLDGSFQHELLAFFSRAYVRQREESKVR